MIVNRRAPYGSGYGAEALDALLAASAFEQDLSVVFLDDGVYQLKRGQQPDTLGFKHYTRTFSALGDFGVERLYVDRISMSDRGLTAVDLIEVPRDDGSNTVTIMSTEDLQDLMHCQNVILQF